MKVFTDISYLTEENRRRVFPLLFDLFYSPNFDLMQKYQVVTTLEACDVAILPVDIGYLYSIKQKKVVQDFVKSAQELQKIVWIYSGNDLGLTVQFDYNRVYVFRLGGNHSKMDKNTFILPSFISDPYENHIEKIFTPIDKSKVPTVGFVGHASSGFKKMLSEVYIYLKYNWDVFTNKICSDYFSLSLAGIKRFELLQQLLKSDAIETNFILRSKYRAGVSSATDKQRTTQEYFENMYANGYTFCFRGGGNFSVRFYETLAMGRIPILVNTDCRLPLLEVIDWSAHCLIVDYKNRDKFITSLLDFHSNLSQDQFKTIQESNRNLWKNFLKRDTYFAIIHQQFCNFETTHHD